MPAVLKVNEYEPPLLRSLGLEALVVGGHVVLGRVLELPGDLRASHSQVAGLNEKFLTCTVGAEHLLVDAELDAAATDGRAPSCWRRTPCSRPTGRTQRRLMAARFADQPVNALGWTAMSTCR